MVIACIVIDPYFLVFYRRCDCDLVVKWCALQKSSIYDIGTSKRTE